MAKWENKTNSMCEKNEQKLKMQKFQEQRLKFMDMRRKKLSDLLKFEEEQYRQEIIAIQETPQQVREKMEQKLKGLVELKEKERQELVQTLNERKFYADADQLRKNDSEAFAVECYLEQENQMLDKLKRREQEKNEEQLYATLNELDIKKKKERERIQQEEVEKKKKETYKFLEWQKEKQKEISEKERNLINIENDRIKAQWEKDNQREHQERIEKIVKNHDVYKNIQEFNKQEEEVKKMRSDIERQKDRELIDNIVNKEKALDEIDRKEKDRKRSEFFQNKKYLEFVMNQKKEAEAWMDKIVAEEADKKWRKEQDAWMKQENARIELMKHVYKEREEAIYRKRKVEQDDKEAIFRERRILEDEIDKYNKKLEEIKVEEARRRKAHQDDLKYQMREKNLLREKEKQDQTYDERAAKLWEMEYQKKIDMQRELHLKRLAEIKAKGMNMEC